jgi:hypothetical protein
MPTARNPLYRRHRFPPEVISRAVWLYFRFPLSLRMVEEMLAAGHLRELRDGALMGDEVRRSVLGPDPPAGSCAR